MSRPAALMILAVVLVSGCLGSASALMNTQASEGDTAQVHYIGMYQNGTVFDTSREAVAQEAGIHNPQRSYNPLELTVGEGQVIEGFDEAILGLSAGEETQVTIPPAEAYGQVDPELILQIPLEQLEEVNITATEGAVISAAGRRGVIKEVGEENATIDFNHPLAGETLVFEVELVSVVNEAS